jgi:hypothetical protein
MTMTISGPPWDVAIPPESGGTQATAAWEAGVSTEETSVSPSKIAAAIAALGGGSGGGASGITFVRHYTAASLPPLSTNNLELATWTIPAALLATLGNNFAIRIFLQINGNGATDTSSLSVRAGLTATAFASLTTLATINAGSASGSVAAEIVLTKSRDVADTYVCFTQGATPTGNNVTTITTFTVAAGNDLKISAGGNIGATDRPYVESGWYSLSDYGGAVAQTSGLPSTFTSRALTDSDKGNNLICASAQVATVNTGLAGGFSCNFKGVITFAGTATVTDVRTTGATNPWCTLMATGTNTYDVVGTKA